MVLITGRVADSAGVEESGRIEFSQAQRIDTGAMLVTSSVAVAQVVNGELRTLAGAAFSLPVNPEGTAVRVKEMLGGRTFEWWVAVPDVTEIEYRLLPVVESGNVPASVFAPPPWLAQVGQMRDETVQAIQDGQELADALGGLPGITAAVASAQAAAGDASGHADDAQQAVTDAAAEADRAEAAADSIDMGAINTRLDGVDASVGALQTDMLGRATKAWVNAAIADVAEYSVPVNGTTNAHTQFQAMLNALPAGSIVQGRAGQRIRLAAPVTIPKAVTIRDLEFVANPSGESLIIGSDDVSLHRLKIHGIATPTYLEAHRFITSTGTPTTPIARTSIRDCVLTNSNGSGIWLLWATDFSIENNYINGTKYAGIMMISPKVGAIHSNVVRNVIHVDPVVNSYGIAVTDSLNTEEARAEDVTIGWNVIEWVPRWEGIDTHGGKRIIVIGNRVRGVRTGIAMTTGNTSRLLPAEDCVVIGNIVDQGGAYGGQNAGIVFNGNPTTAPATGVIGPNVIRGFNRALRLENVDPVKLRVEPQSTDATVDRGPGQQPNATLTRSTSATVLAGTKEREYAATWPTGMFTNPPVVIISKANDVGKEFIPYVKDVTAEGCRYGVYAPANVTAQTIVGLSMIVIQAHPGGGGEPRP